MTTRRVLKTSLLPTIRETSRTEQYLKVQNEALELFKKKNNDYGDAFATYGTVGIIVRLGDKISRLSSVTRNGINLVDSESLRDTLMRDMGSNRGLSSDSDRMSMLTGRR